MTLSTMLFWIAVIAIILTAIFHFGFKKVKSPLVSVLQNFCGILFIFSGWVKAVDSMGTAFKMEEYFGEFQMTFQESALSFIAPIFPVMAEYALAFSVFMILLEMVVGIMLVLGVKSKLTSWAFLLIIVFFTILTGFTFLTGYVPSGENFFSFSKWGPYLESNMRVTDCGCFGEFIKPTPRSTFLKNIFFLFPAFFFIFKHKDFHRIFKPHTRNAISWLSAIALLWYCLNNFAWNLPHIDFRPFQEGLNIRDQRQAEIDASQNVKITGFLLKDRQSGEPLEVATQEYYKMIKEDKKGMEEQYEFVDQIKEDPVIPLSKLSEFMVEDFEGYDMTDSILNGEAYKFIIISYELEYEPWYESVTKMDTSYLMDTISVFDGNTETIQIVKSIDKISERKEDVLRYTFDEELVDDYKKIINPVMDKAQDEGYLVQAIVGGISEEEVKAFKLAADCKYEFFEADDILLKTIIRSNPGVMLMKDGMIVKKWHKKKLPDWETIKEDYIN